MYNYARFLHCKLFKKNEKEAERESVCCSNPIAESRVSVFVGDVCTVQSIVFSTGFMTLRYLLGMKRDFLSQILTGHPATVDVLNLHHAFREI